MENKGKVDWQLNEAVKCLRKKFLRQWKAETKNEWENSKANGKDLLTRFEIKPPFFDEQRSSSREKKVNKWDVKNWDLSLLVQVLLPLLNIKREISRDEPFIKALGSARNEWAHCNGCIKNERCVEMCSSIQSALKHFGYSDSELKILQEKSEIASKLPAEVLCDTSDTNEASKMLEEGRDCLSEGRIGEAIQKLSMAMLLPDVWPSVLSRLCITRSEAILKLGRCRSSICKAQKDALEAVKLSPNYVESHNQLALVYEAAEDFEKAEKHFDIAFGFDPTNLSMKTRRNNARFMKQLKKYMAEEKMWRGTDDLMLELIEWNEKQNSGRTTTEIFCELLLGNDPWGITFKGHLFREGKDYQMAAEEYSNAAVHKYSEANFSISLLKLFGWGMKTNFDEAVRILQEISTQPFGRLEIGVTSLPKYGVAEAGFILGLYYEEGTREYFKAEESYKRAIRGNNSCGLAGYRLGVMFYNGKGKTAVEIWRRAATSKSCGYNLLAFQSMVAHYIRTENFKKAIEAYRRYVAMANEHCVKMLPLNQDEFREKMADLVTEKSDGNEIELKQRIGSFIKTYFSQVGLKDEIDPQAVLKIPDNILENTSPPALAERLNVLADKGNVYAQRLLKTQNYFESAMKIFTSAQTNFWNETSIQFIKNYSGAIRLELHFISVPVQEKSKILTFLIRGFQLLTAAGAKESNERYELEKDLRVCLIFQNMQDGAHYESLKTFTTQSRDTFPEEEFFYSALCFMYAIRKDSVEIVVKEANRGLKKFPTNHSLLYCKAVAQATHRYLSQQTIIDGCLEYVKNSPQGDRNIPQVYYILAVSYRKLFKQKCEKDDENDNGEKETMLWLKYYKKAKNSEICSYSPVRYSLPTDS